MWKSRIPSHIRSILSWRRTCKCEARPTNSLLHWDFWWLCGRVKDPLHTHMWLPWIGWACFTVRIERMRLSLIPSSSATCSHLSLALAATLLSKSRRSGGECSAECMGRAMCPTYGKKWNNINQQQVHTSFSTSVRRGWQYLWGRTIKSYIASNGNTLCGHQTEFRLLHVKLLISDYVRVVIVAKTTEWPLALADQGGPVDSTVQLL